MWLEQQVSTVVATLLLLVICGSFAEDGEPPCSGACQIRFKCSNVEEATWAMDNGSCLVFRNECYLKNENCQRQDNCQKELVKVPKSACKGKCIACPNESSPVCAEYNGAKKEFPNDCERNSYNCRTGEIWDLYTYGTC